MEVSKQKLCHLTTTLTRHPIILLHMHFYNNSALNHSLTGSGHFLESGTDGDLEIAPGFSGNVPNV